MNDKISISNTYNQSRSSTSLRYSIGSVAAKYPELVTVAIALIIGSIGLSFI